MSVQLQALCWLPENKFSISNSLPLMSFSSQINGYARGRQNIHYALSKYENVWKNRPQISQHGEKDGGVEHL